MRCTIAIALLAISSLTAAEQVLDRLAVVVGNTAITESEVDQEVRLTEFMNGQPLDVNSEIRRAAAERLVDQQLIRNEMQAAALAMPSTADVQSMVSSFRHDHYPGDAAFQAALHRYGLTEQQLRQHLAWQLAVIRFTDIRFKPQVMQPPPLANQSADRSAQPGTPAPAPTTVDQVMNTWLKEQRATTRIEFKQGAFQ
jgi:hypothetical protein